MTLKQQRTFNQNDLGLPIGRESSRWIDIDLFGHQITFVQLSDKAVVTNQIYGLDNKRLPVFHIGIILSREDWNHELSKQ